MKRVLVACEFSQIVTNSFRRRGFDAWSCDVLPTEGKVLYHIQGDVLRHLNKFWDLLIAHPPCTYLCNSGVCWLHWEAGARTKKNWTLQKRNDRWKKMIQAVEFFNALRSANIPHIAIENPIPHCYARDSKYVVCNTVSTTSKGIGKYTQIIQPYQFGHPEQKATCLWLKNLPKLKPTKVVTLPTDRKKRMRLHYLSPGPDRWKERSRTYQGIADAMAEQWGDYIESKK